MGKGKGRVANSLRPFDDVSGGLAPSLSALSEQTPAIGREPFSRKSAFPISRFSCFLLESIMTGRAREILTHESHESVPATGGKTFPARTCSFPLFVHALSIRDIPSGSSIVRRSFIDRSSTTILPADKIPFRNSELSSRISASLFRATCQYWRSDQ